MLWPQRSLAAIHYIAALKSDKPKMKNASHVNSITLTSTWPGIMAILLLAAGLQAAMLWGVLPLAAEKGIVPPTVGKSPDMYLSIARNLVSDQGFRVTPETAETMMRGPGYPYFLAGLFIIFGESHILIQLSNIAMVLGTAVIVFTLTRRFTENVPVSLLSAMILTFHPAILLLETRASLECLFMFLLALFMLLFYRALEQNSLHRFFIAGLVLGLALLTRTTPLLILGLLFLYLLTVYRQNKPWKHATVKIAVLSLGMFLVLSPWMARNYSLMGTPTFSESLIGVAAFQGAYITKTMSDGRSYSERVHESSVATSKLAAANGVPFVRFEDDKYWDLFFSIEDELMYNKILLTHTLGEYSQNPLFFAKHCLYNAVRFWFQGATPKITILGTVIMLPIMVLAGIGLVRGIRHGLRVIPLALPIIAVYAVSIPLISNARYTTPLLPFLLVMAGIALTRSLPSQRHTEVDQLS